MPEQISDLELRLLGDAYALKFATYDDLDVPSWLESQGIDLPYPRCVGPAMRVGLATFYDWDTRKVVEVTAETITFVELHNLADRALIRRLQTARKLILAKLVATDRDFYETQFLNHSEVGLTFLEMQLTVWYMGCMGRINGGCHYPDHGPQAFGMGLTPEGKEAHESWAIRASIEARWRELQGCTNMTPQQRGHELEKLLEVLCGFHRVLAQRSVRAPGEENDLIISVNFEHFIVSCKWEQQRAKPEYVNSLIGRIGRRAGSRGLLVSGSGFSRNVAPFVQSSTGQGLVVLFGAGDLERLFTFQRSPLDLLEERYRLLVVHGQAVFENGTNILAKPRRRRVTTDTFPSE